MVCGIGHPIPTNTARWNNDVLLLAQRLRRWPNIKTSLFQRAVFAGMCLHVVGGIIHIFIMHILYVKHKEWKPKYSSIHIAGYFSPIYQLVHNQF